MHSGTYYAYKLCSESQLEKLAKHTTALMADNALLQQYIAEEKQVRTDYASAPEDDVFDSLSLWLQWHADGSVELCGQVYKWEIGGSKYKCGIIRRFDRFTACSTFLKGGFASAEICADCFSEMKPTAQ